eukprot:1212461-Rhodomonas_salina.2
MAYGTGRLKGGLGSDEERGGHVKDSVGRRHEHAVADVRHHARDLLLNVHILLANSHTQQGRRAGASEA